MMLESASRPGELPDPSPELVLYRVHVEALISVLGRRKGERYLRLMADKLSTEDALADVLAIRPSDQWVAVNRARKQAVEIFRRYLPIWRANLPEKE